MNRKYFFPKIILLIIILSLVVFIGFKINWSKVNVLFNKALIELNLTPNQKTYTNTKFGFQISYPGDWLIYKGIDGVMWYKSDSKSEIDPKVLIVNWHDPNIIYDLNARCDKNKTCQKIDTITTNDKTLIGIWEPTKEGKKYVNSVYLGFIENSNNEVVPVFSTDFNDIQTFKTVLSSFKFVK
jgi:hypothetical protein